MQAASAHAHGAGEVVWPLDPQFARASAGKIAMWVFLVSDAFSFFGLLLAYGILRGESSAWHQPGEPDLSVVLGAGLTAVLIASSVMMIFAFEARARGQVRQASGFLAATAALGILFLVGQYAEYFGIFHPGLAREGLVFGRSAYANTFYVITSFHALHVFSGTVYILIVLARNVVARSSPGEFELLGLFWHFVDLVWIFVFTLLYLLPVG
jgi:heme/copper-type cytochrome/quinol oxidase subunit 3